MDARLEIEQKRGYKSFFSHTMGKPWCAVFDVGKKNTSRFIHNKCDWNFHDFTRVVYTVLMYS